VVRLPIRYVAVCVDHPWALHVGVQLSQDLSGTVQVVASEYDLLRIAERSVLSWHVVSQVLLQAVNVLLLSRSWSTMHMIWLAASHASFLSCELLFCSFFFVFQAFTAAVRQTVY